MAAQPQQPSAFGGGGGSFLGTAAAAAAGVVGGSLLAGSIRSMMGGGGNQQSFGDTGRPSAAESKTAGRGAISPAAIWRATPGSTTSVRPSQRADNNDNDSGSRQGFFDQASNDDDDDMDHDSDGFDGDDGDGDSDYA